MPDLPDAALTAAAVAIHDADCPDRTCDGPPLGHCYRLAAVALEAAEPALTADLRERLDHATQALAGNHEGIRLWMLDCAELTAKHRAHAEQAEAELAGARTQAIAAERERIRTYLIGGDPGRLESAFRRFVDDDHAADCALAVAELLDTEPTP